MNRLKSDKRFCPNKFQEFTELAQNQLATSQFKSLSEEDLARFLVARESNVSAAWKQLEGSVEWRITLDVSSGCRLCQKDPTSHSHIPIGKLQGDEPSTIFYGCPARATHSSVDEIVHHVAIQLEHCFSSTSSTRWVWCVDYNGFGVKEALQGKLAAKFGKLFSNHMPERLHKILLLNPPSIFRLLLQAAKPFVDKRTLDKLVPITGSSSQEVLKQLSNHGFAPDTLEWLETVLNQTLPAKLPPLPHASKTLLLPSLVPVFEFSSSRDDKELSSSSHPVRVSVLLSGELDTKNQIKVFRA